MSSRHRRGPSRCGHLDRHLYNELDLQKAHYETRIAVLAEEVSQKDKARADARLQQPSGPHAKSWKKKRPAWPLCQPSFQTPAKSWQKERQTFDARLQKVALAARRDCAGLSRDWVRLYNEALGLAAGAGGGPGGEGADPAGTAQNAGQAGTAGTGIRGDALATPEDVLAHVRDYGGYCRGLEIQLGTLARAVSP